MGEAGSLCSSGLIAEFIGWLRSGSPARDRHAPRGPGASPIPMWHQAIGRETATAPCPAGYTGSWANWPNADKCGHVGNTFVSMYGS